SHTTELLDSTQKAHFSQFRQPVCHTPFPRNLTIPPFLRSNVWAIVPLVMRGPTTVFTHRGLSPHQFTPMSGAHSVERVAGPVWLFRFGSRSMASHRSSRC